MPKIRFKDAGVEAVFSAYPLPVQRKLLALRSMIFDVAKKTSGVGQLEEALRWGQPSYLTSETSGLIDDFKELYRDEMDFVGNRSIVFGIADRLPEDALRHCISLALTYHFKKRAHQK